MDDKSQWDWNLGQRDIADMASWRSKFNWVEEPQVSPDGEKIAAIVNQAEGEFTVCGNGQAWENIFDKIWYLRTALPGRTSSGMPGIRCSARAEKLSPLPSSRI